MAINPAQAIKAFDAAARLGGGSGGGMEARETPKSTFMDTLEKVANDSIDTNKKAEALTEQAAVGDADLLDVVNAVSNAEVTLQTVVAVRDRVMSAYQEILRMPI